MKELEELEFSGYLASIQPKIRRGLIEYKLKVISTGGEERIFYLRKPPTWLKHGLMIAVKALRSKQTREERWIIDELRIIKGKAELKFIPTMIEDITSGRFTIVYGRKGEKMFSLPIKDQELISKLLGKLPRKMYCMFMELESELRLVEVIDEREYEVIMKVSKFLKEMNEKEAQNRRILRDFLKN